MQELVIVEFTLASISCYQVLQLIPPPSALHHHPVPDRRAINHLKFTLTRAQQHHAHPARAAKAAGQTDRERESAADHEEE